MVNKFPTRLFSFFSHLLSQTFWATNLCVLPNTSGFWVWRKFCFSILWSASSFTWSRGWPVTMGFLRGSCVNSFALYPRRTKFNLTESIVSPWLRRIWILPLPVQTPLKLSSSTVAFITCLLPDIFLRTCGSVWGGRLPITRSTTWGAASLAV